MRGPPKEMAACCEGVTQSVLWEAVGGRSKVEDEHRSGAQGEAHEQGCGLLAGTVRDQPQTPAPSINTLGP